MLTRHILLFLCLFSLPLRAWIDVEEELLDDFVLETKQIEIPGFPDAFNPCIMRWQGAFLMSFRTGAFELASDDTHVLMSFRIRDPITAATNQIGLVLLDQNFNVVSEPQILDIPSSDPHFAMRHQDPRLLAVGDRVYMVFSNIIEGLTTQEIRRMFVCQLYFDGERFYTDEPDCMMRFEGENEQRWQKNWVPFDFQGQLLLAYSIQPHRILFPFLGSGRCETIAQTSGDIEWNWGVLRGGTPALRHENEYLGFFHSSKEMHSQQSFGKKISHYYFGAYTFSANPPFNLTRISKKPIVGKKFYNGPLHNTWKPLRVVFPCGFIYDKEFVWVAYGRQDHEIWIVKLDKRGLLNSLAPVSSIE